MATYLVTGGAGFIGSHLVDRLLSQGHHVRVLDDLSTGKCENLDPRCELIASDICDAALLRSAFDGVTGCYHLAAIASVIRSNEDWIGTHRVNQTGTITVLDEARRAGGVPVVYASSAAVYGDRGQGLVREDALTTPMTAYGADKLGSELHARVAYVVHQVPTIGLRFFNVYGPRQDPTSPYSGVISTFASRVLAGQPLTIHGDGRQSRDFIFVRDVTAHLYAAMQKLGAHRMNAVYNVCTGRSTTILALAQMMGKLAGRDPELIFAPARAGEIRYSAGDPAGATAALNVAARFRPEDTLPLLLQHASPSVS